MNVFLPAQLRSLRNGAAGRSGKYHQEGIKGSAFYICAFDSPGLLLRDPALESTEAR
jgi:hypothetical protein